MRFFHVFGALCLLGAVLSAPLRVHATDPYHRPTPGNQFVTTTDKYLYVVWSVPKDLGPLAGHRSPEQLEAFVARTAIFLCHAHTKVEPKQEKPCKVQVVRMNTNDEYTKSAAGGFKTVAEAVLSRTHADAESLERALGLDLPALKAWFTTFTVKHDRLKPS